METVYIYGLECPILNRIMYIGKSNNPRRRYNVHKFGCDGSVKTKKNRWINWLIGKGLCPTLVFIEVCNSDNWVDREQHWIHYFAKHNPALTNTNYRGYKLLDAKKDKLLIAQMMHKEGIRNIKEIKCRIFEHVDLPIIKNSMSVTISDLFITTSLP